MTQQPPPPEIPGHEFESYIASGGFGDVFAYRDNIDRRVAVKVLRLTTLTPERVEQFKVEAARMAGLEHDHVVRVYGFGETADGRPYISMEYCDDHLGTRARSGTLPVLDVLRLSIQVSSAVDAAHRAGLFHRDIKPANVLLKRNGEPALTDFGIAGGRAAGENANRGASLRYAAREVLAEESDGDERSDVYSLGATTFALLTGRSPVEVPGGDNSEAALVDRAMAGVTVGGMRSDVPASLQRVLARALKPRPASRYPSAMAYGRALQAVEVELGFTPTAVSYAADSERIAEVGPRIDDDPDGTRAATPLRVDPAGPTGRPSGVDGDASTERPGQHVRPAAFTPDAPVSGVAPELADDHTVVREGAVAPASGPAPGAVGTSPDEESDDPGASRGVPVVPIVAGIALIGAVSGMVLLGGGGDATPEPDVSSTAAVDDDQLDVLFSQPTVPTGVSVTRTADEVEVTWDADPVDDATYVVSITEGPEAGGSVASATPQATLEDPEPSVRVCVRVLSVVGDLSSEPSQEECTG